MHRRLYCHRSDATISIVKTHAVNNSVTPTERQPSQHLNSKARKCTVERLPGSQVAGLKAGMSPLRDIRDTRQSWPTLSGWKILLLTIRNDFTQKFIDVKPFVSFCSRLQSCIAAAGWHSEKCLNVEWAIGKLTFVTEMFEQFLRSCANFYVFIREYSIRNCMFT